MTTQQVEPKVERVGDAGGGRPERELPTVTPPVDVRERQNDFVLTADVPGADESSVDVSVENGIMSIQAQVHSESPAGYNGVVREFGPAAYRRVLRLPDGVNPSAVTARLRHGVLEITVPKRDDVKARRIAVVAA